MSATVMLWKSHAGGFFDFGHASLALSYEDEVDKLQLATITWYPAGDRNRERKVLSGAVTSSGIKGGHPSSGMSSGWQKSSHPANVFDELSMFAGNHAQEIHALQNLNQRSQQQDERLQALKQYYPRVRDFRTQANNGWLQPFLNHAASPQSQLHADTVLRTRICPPTEMVTLPTLSDPDTHVGLNDVTMFEWWSSFSSEKKKYNLLGRNCSSAVAMAMIAGGALSFVKAPKIGAWTPKRVTQWASEVREAIVKDQQKFATAKNAIVSRKDTVADEPASRKEVWSAGEFRANSKGKSRFATRYDELKQVDDALKAYHRVRTAQGTPAHLRNLQILALADVVICLHRAIVKPRYKSSFSSETRQSHRLKGLLTLGLQALNRIDQLKREQARGKLLKEEYSRLLGQLAEDLNLHRDLESMEKLNRLFLGLDKEESTMAASVKQVLQNIVSTLGYEPEFQRPDNQMIQQNRVWRPPQQMHHNNASGPFDLMQSNEDPEPMYDYLTHKDSLDMPYSNDGSPEPTYNFWERQDSF